MSAELVSIEDTPLTADEQEDFRTLEADIRGGLDSMEKAGKALIQIRDRKLYRGQFRTFKLYVETKWQTSVRSAYQICGFAEVVENLRANGAQILPSNERQTRELAKLPAVEQVKVFTEVVREGKPTAAAIRKKAAKAPEPSPVIDVESTREEMPASADYEHLKGVWNFTSRDVRRNFLYFVFGLNCRRSTRAAIEGAIKR